MRGAARPRLDRRRALATAFSITSHILILLALLSARGETSKRAEQAPITVELVAGLPSAVQPSIQASAPSPSAQGPAPTLVRPLLLASAADPLPTAKVSTAAGGTQLTDAQIAGASSADSGGAGGPCDMARRVQSALRKDSLVQAAVANSAGKATLVWDGDWVKSNGEDGKGLAAVREAIVWEVAFAPEACRGQTVRGLVLLSMNTDLGARRLAVGAEQWRWSDLLKPRPGVSDEPRP